MPISRSQMYRELRNKGGIMNAVPRQSYFLGGIGDAIKDTVKGVAKGISGLIKSPMGKAALIGGGLFGIPGTQFGGLLGKGSIANIIGQKAMTQAPFAKGTGIKGFFQNILGGEKTLGTTAKVFAGGTALGAVLEASGLGDDEKRELVASRNIDALKGYLRKGYRNLNPEAKDEEVETFVEENTREYAAGGGIIRKNFAMGSEEDIPEIEEVSSEELLDILKSIGADKEQESGIKSLDKKRLMAFTGGSKMRDLGLDEDYIREIRIQWLEAGKPMSFSNFLRNDLERQAEMYDEAKAQDFSYGGRVGFESGTPKKKKSLDDIPLIKGPYKIKYDEDGNRIKPEMPKGKPFRYNPDLIYKPEKMPYYLTKPLKKAMGGRIGYAKGTDKIVDQASGIMGLPKRINGAGVKELDLRESGGFIPPVGVKEKADDIPAMLSNNEFVFTADAVRGMGNGNVNKGAQRMYDMMKKLESKVV